MQFIKTNLFVRKYKCTCNSFKMVVNPSKTKLRIVKCFFIRSMRWQAGRLFSMNSVLNSKTCMERLFTKRSIMRTILYVTTVYSGQKNSVWLRSFPIINLLKVDCFTAIYILKITKPPNKKNALFEKKISK